MPQEPIVADTSGSAPPSFEGMRYRFRDAMTSFEAGREALPGPESSREALYPPSFDAAQGGPGPLCEEAIERFRSVEGERQTPTRTNTLISKPHAEGAWPTIG